MFEFRRPIKIHIATSKVMDPLYIKQIQIASTLGAIRTKGPVLPLLGLVDEPIVNTGPLVPNNVQKRFIELLKKDKKVVAIAYRFRGKRMPGRYKKQFMRLASRRLGFKCSRYY